jgi:hypothetical protein
MPPLSPLSSADAEAILSRAESLALSVLALKKRRGGISPALRMILRIYR